MLPSASVAPSPTPAPSLAGVPDPFTVVKSFSWDSTKLAIPLGMDVGPDGLLYILDIKPSVTVIDPSDGHIVRAWGRQGTGPGEFDLTRPDDNPGTGDIAVAPDGRVYVADGSNHRVQVFRPDGSFVSQFGSFGTGDGQFGSVDEIATGRDGSVYLRDLSSNRISKFTADGKFLWHSPPRDSDPDLASNMQGIAVRPDGSVLVSCETCDHLQVFDSDSGRFVGKLQMPEIDGDAGSIALDRAGNVNVSTYISESTLVFDPKGSLIAARYLTGSMQRMDIGKQASWGDVFWPSPVYLPDGRAFTFWKNGLAELKVTLPAH